VSSDQVAAAAAAGYNWRAAAADVVTLLMARHDIVYPFLQPVTEEEAPDYFESIDEPMDLGTVMDNLKNGQRKYAEPAQVRDVCVG
jgi:hypothetical protein